MKKSQKFNLKKFYIGVDVGGTSIKFGVFDGNKKFIEQFSVVTEFRTKNAEKTIVKDMLDSIERYCEDNEYGATKAKIAGIGFAIPGPVVNNQVLRAVNINWKKKYDIEKEAKRRLGKKVKIRVYNDANAAALGEYKLTLKGKYKSICLMTLGTAVGIGIIINGKLIEGKSGIAGELSHLKVDFADDAMKCNCGNTGCLETVAGGRGIANVYNKMYNTDIAHGAQDVIRHAKEGDEKAIAALEKSLDYLSTAISIVMLVYEPEIILIGGGVSNEGTYITQIIKKCLKKKMFITDTLPKILIAKLKNKAGLYGAVSEL